MIRTPQHMASNIRSLLEYAHHDTAELEDIEVKQLRNQTIPNHVYIEVRMPNGLVFLITVEEV